MPVKLFDEKLDLKCIQCGKNLMNDPDMAIVIFMENHEKNSVAQVSTCCKGDCDTVFQEKIRLEDGVELMDGWKELTTFMNPLLFLRHWFSVMNRMRDGMTFSDEAYEDYKNILLAGAQYICREPNELELKRAIQDVMFTF